MISLRCDCGRLLKLKDSAAGRRVKCPDCGDPVDVPEPDDVYDDYEDEDDYEDSYEDDEDDPPARPQRRPSGGGSRKRKQQSSPNPAMLIGIAGGIAALAVIAGVAVAVMQFGGDGPPDPADIAREIAENPLGIDVPVPPGQPPAALPGTRPVDVPGAMPVGTNSGGVNPGGANAKDDLWVVLSNLKLTRSVGAFGKTISIDYRIAEGQPNPSRKYILYVGQSSAGGMMERYIAYDEFTLSDSGTIKFDVDPTFSTMIGKTRAFVGYSIGHKKWEKVSGEAEVGKTTAATRPPSVQEIAGTDAEGKLLALANAKIDNGPGPTSFSVDLVLQGQLDSGRRYFLVAEGPDGRGGWNVEISRDLRTATVGETKSIGRTLLAVVGGREGWPLTVYVEKRSLSRLRSDDSEVVSNRVTATGNRFPR